jgi:phosphatidate cytidylyltransferase
VSGSPQVPAPSATRTRLVTAVIMVAVLLGVTFLMDALGLVALIVTIILMGAWEWSAFLQLQGLLPRLVYVGSVVLGLVLAWSWTATAAGLHWLMAAAALWWIATAFNLAWTEPRANRFHALVAGWMALVPAAVALLRLRLDWQPGVAWFLFALCLPFVADTAAYFVGRRFGRTKLAPAISPGKSREGALGGLLAVGLVGAALAPALGQPVLPFAGLCIVAGVFSIVGDLSESRFKRLADLKDSGTLLPGHGGVLDRIDSVTAAAPILLFGLPWLGHLA